jgi:hypothetical protein
VTQPPWVEALLLRVATDLTVRGVLGVYAHGSLATGDFADGSSDLDLVAVTARPVSPAERDELRRWHRELGRDRRAAMLHCAYVEGARLEDLGQSHPTWAHEDFLDRPLSAVARAELLAGALVLAGPPAGALIPELAVGTLQDEVRREVDTYWRRAARRHRPWWRDIWVDIGLTSMVRARSVLEEGRQISKVEAMRRLPGAGVPSWIVADMISRRAGESAGLNPLQRAARARAARAAMLRLVDELTG